METVETPMLRHETAGSGPITEEDVEMLLELEAQPSCPSDAGVQSGWVKLGSPKLELELWKDPSSDEPSNVFRLRGYLTLSGVKPALATKLLYNVAARQRWDSMLEKLEDLSDDRAQAVALCDNSVVHLQTRSTLSVLPACEILHRRLLKAPCGNAYSAWISRDVDEEVAPAKLGDTWLAGFRQWAERFQCFRLEKAVMGHVVRRHEDGCRVFTYVQMEATSLVISLGPRLAPEIMAGVCGELSEACQAELAEEAPRIIGDRALAEGEFSLRHVPEVFDISVGDETGSAASDAGAEASSHSAGLDFLGVVENKKLVPAISAFRRLLRKSARGAARKHEAEEGQLPGSGGANSGSVELAEPAWTSRRKRSSALREKNRERQRGSMEAVAERLGEAVRLRSQHGRDSALEVVPEEEDDGSKAKLTSGEVEQQASETVGTPAKSSAAQAGVASVQQRKRFSLPVPTRRRRSSASARSVGTDSEDSMSSAGFSGAGNDEDNYRSAVATVVDSIFDRARSARHEGSSALSTTTASSISSRASSPCLGTPLASSPTGASTELHKVAKPTLAGAAWVLTQLCKESSPQDESPTPEQSSSVQGDCQVATRTLRGSLMSAEAFKFCFPQDICGVPLESKAAYKDPGWKRSSARNRRRATAA